jgi:hypothetical protein
VKKQEPLFFPKVSGHQKNHRMDIPVERENQPFQPGDKGSTGSPFPSGLKAKGGFFFSSPVPDGKNHTTLKHILDPVNPSVSPFGFSGQ